MYERGETVMPKFIAVVAAACEDGPGEWPRLRAAVSDCIMTVSGLRRSSGEDVLRDSSAARNLLRLVGVGALGDAIPLVTTTPRAAS